MKYIKLYENFNEEDIHKICKKYAITNYTINEDGSIDVDGDVNLRNKGLTKIPLKFRNVSGYFNCSDNNLTSLEGCPENITGEGFYCRNNKLTSFKFMPKIKFDFICKDNDIKDFKGFVEPGRNFFCENNPIYNIWLLFYDKSHIELLNDYDCIRGENIVIDRLNEFLEEIDKPKVGVIGYKNI